MAPTGAKVTYLILDSGALIKNAPVQDIGTNIYSVPGIVDEIRDRPTRHRLQVLPFEMKFREPSTEAIKFITDFSKKTGDYPSLSAMDIKLLALTYQIEKEQVGTEHLNMEPVVNRTVKVGRNTAGDLGTVAGFYMPKKKVTKEDKQDTNKELENNLEHLSLDGKEGSDTSQTSQEKYSDINIPKVEILVKDMNEGNNGECNEDGDGKGIEENEDEWIISENTDEWSNEEEENELEEEDDEGWITPANIDEAKKERGLISIDDDNTAEVACLTTDFSMQNVLKQIGLQVVSVNGMLIKHTKTFILRCYSCFKTTSIMTKVFCPKCGNKTLKRVTVTLNEDGSQEIHLSSRVKLTGKGKRFSLPMPKGGMHAQNPIVCEDQHGPRCLPTRKAKEKTNVMDTDYIAGVSPFATHDLYSRSAMLGFHSKEQQPKYWTRRNHAIQTKKNAQKRKK